MRLLLTMLCALCATTTAHALTLDGVFKQGGFAFGQTKPGSEVTFEGMDVPVGEDGTFAVGFHRHFPAEAHFKITLPDGTIQTKAMIIEPRDYETQYVEGVNKKHVSPSKEHLKRIRGEAAQINKARTIYEDLPYIKTGFSWPVSGTITGVYGSRRFYNGEERSWHKGLDVAKPTGTPLYAPAPAKVRLALADSFFNGNLVVLDHGHQLYSLYAHLDKMDVKEGDTVTTGDKIGEIGTTGRSTGPHLHWGVYWRKIALDPKLFMEYKK